jgi:hypothetical protein
MSKYRQGIVLATAGLTHRDLGGFADIAVGLHSIS